jgi:hypothetical protein
MSNCLPRSLGSHVPAGSGGAGPWPRCGRHILTVKRHVGPDTVEGRSLAWVQRTVSRREYPLETSRYPQMVHKRSPYPRSLDRHAAATREEKTR